MLRVGVTPSVLTNIGVPLNKVSSIKSYQVLAVWQVLLKIQTTIGQDP